MVNKNKLRLFTIISILIIFIDQLSKQLILTLKPDISFVIGKIHFVANTGAGFGILQGKTFLLAIVSLAVALAIIINYRNIPPEKHVQILFAVFLGGVIGNLIDRVFRKFVVDFIDLTFWPAFNIADTSISLAAIGLVIYFWKK